MFGYIRPYAADLTEEEQKRYRAVYCGLCRALNERFGLAGRLGLNFDMTFLILLLNSLYEPKETRKEALCPPHPVKKHEEISTEFTAYAADMTVVLAYFKALDDWEDEGKRRGKFYADLLKKHYAVLEKRWPGQCRVIEESIAALHAVERDDGGQPEKAADLTGQMLGAVFAVKEDFWQGQLAWLGYALGKFIYMLDAAMDYEQDLKKECSNPLIGMQIAPRDARPLLQQPIGQAAEAFEKLPLVQDVHIMRNILYSGVWQAYNAKFARKEGDQDGQ